jgi:hypothetical protein
MYPLAQRQMNCQGINYPYIQTTHEDAQAIASTRLIQHNMIPLQTLIRQSNALKLLSLDTRYCPVEIVKTNSY